MKDVRYPNVCGTHIAKRVFGLTFAIGHLRRPETVFAERSEFPPERAETGVVGGTLIREAPRPSHEASVGMHVYEHTLAVRGERRVQLFHRDLDVALPLPGRKYRRGVRKYGLRLPLARGGGAAVHHRRAVVARRASVVGRGDALSPFEWEVAIRVHPEPLARAGAFVAILLPQCLLPALLEVFTTIGVGCLSGPDERGEEW